VIPHDLTDCACNDKNRDRENDDFHSSVLPFVDASLVNPERYGVLPVRASRPGVSNFSHEGLRRAAATLAREKSSSSRSDETILSGETERLVKTQGDVRRSRNDGQGGLALRPVPPGDRLPGETSLHYTIPHVVGQA